MTALPDEHPLDADLLGDPARVAAVRRVLQGSTTAVGLDRITRLAAELLDAPRAQVSLLAEEQVVASAFGVVMAPEQRVGALADSLCTVTVRLGAPFAVSDAREDPRVSDLPPVVSGAVVSYLGVPLITSTGLTLGALCVYDDRVRAWSARDVGVLSELAASAIAELELRAVSAEMATKAAQLDLALSAAETGSFDYDLVTGELRWDDRLIHLFGYQRGEFGERIEDFNARVHPEDRDRVAASLDRTVELLGDLAMEYRIVRPDGVRWVEARGRVLPGVDGRPLRLLGVAYDTTELREARDRLARTLESMTDAFFSVDRDWRFTFVNPEAEQLLGRSQDDLLGRNVWEEFPAAVGTAFEEQYRGAVDTGRPASFEAYYPPPLDSWYDIRAWPSADGLSVYFHDVTDRRQAEAEREQAVVERERAYAEAEAANARLSLLADASHLFAQSLEPRQVLQHLSDVLLPSMGSMLAVALTGESAAMLLQRELPENDALHVVHVAHADPRQQPALQQLLRTIPVTTGDAVGAGSVVRTGEPEWLPEITDELLEQFASDEIGLADLKDLQLGRVFTVPLVSRGRRLGAVSVGEPATGLVDRALVTDLAARAAVALDNALLYGVERRTGLTLQRSLLPGEVPRLPGIEVAVRYRPGATGAFVGGDWYQGVVVGDELVLCMGDVMGHGMRSAARMGQLRAIVATLALEGHGPGSLLSRLAESSDVLLDLELATLLVASYSPSRRTLTVASAGHPPPLLAPLGQEPRYVDVVPGPPIGSLPGSYEETVVDVPIAATLVLYTDGLVEQRGEALDVGLEALRAALAELQLPPEEVADHVLDVLGRSEGAADDVALLVMSHLPDA
ncbi:MAG: putative sensor protein [Frankiales bacterium]|nr:putative sensor protein [Frankiales bacterium]